MSHKMLINLSTYSLSPFIVKVSVLGYFPLLIMPIIYFNFILAGICNINEYLKSSSSITNLVLYEL